MDTDAPKTITIKLDEPVEHGGKTFAELTFRRLKGRDLLVMDKVKGEMAKTFAMLASMASVPMGVFEEMDADDFQRLMIEVVPLLGKSAEAATARVLLPEIETAASPE